MAPTIRAARKDGRLNGAPNAQVRNAERGIKGGLTTVKTTVRWEMRSTRKGRYADKFSV